MRILVAHNDYGRPSGEEHALETLAGLAQRQGHGIVWLRRSSAEIDHSIAGNAKAFFAGIHNPWMARRMAKTLDGEKPDLVLVQNLYPLLSPSVLTPCARRGIPVVMRCPNYRLFCPSGLHLSHGEVCERCLGGREYWCVLRNCERDVVKSAGYALRGWAARVSRRILDNVNIVIVLSEFQKQRFIAQGIPPERIEILPNMTPAIADGDGQKAEIAPSSVLRPPSSVPDPSSVHRPPSSGSIAFVGRASPEKGIEDFVAAARLLPNLPFAVAGATERMPELVAASPPNVRWLGFLNRPDLNRIISESRLVVLSTRCFEGFPNVVTHAMALRKPVVASRIGVLPEIVDEGRTGLLFETRNVADLVQKIQALVADPALCARLGEAGREKALRVYSEDVVAKRFMEICQKALSAKREAVGGKR
ncbi:MAG TPA: glycosyltransferase family 4 protein [Candidatus Paceibacterota bacterium]|nr:glycosyltransferase family 4 protein [Verrucomicrobiota bacterium]HSA12691.1 glycosyltransferase family 4 protein [Candidatus Paceibacterota bacterium]